MADFGFWILDFGFWTLVAKFLWVECQLVTLFLNHLSLGEQDTHK